MNTVKILVIEDDVDLNGFFRKYLTVQGYNVKSIYSCEEALNTLIYDEIPDVVIVDLELWDGNCLPILELLEKPKYKSVKVIVCSGYTVSSDYDINMDRVHQFLLKPVSPRSLSLLVKSLAPIPVSHVAKETAEFSSVYILPSIR
jgi:DNA-binding response OmpR family regulator